MRYSGFIAAAAALGLCLASLPADAASERHQRGASARGATSTDNMADDLNDRSLARAQAGQDSLSGSSGGSMMGSGTGRGMSGDHMGTSGYGAGRGGMSGSSMGGPGMSGGGGTGSSGPVGTSGGMR